MKIVQVAVAKKSLSRILVAVVNLYVLVDSVPRISNASANSKGVKKIGDVVFIFYKIAFAQKKTHTHTQGPLGLKKKSTNGL